MAAAPPQLELFLVLTKDDAETCQRKGVVEPRYAGRSDYIGLRETRAGAVERAILMSTSPSREVGPSTHIMFKFLFTMEGIATYTVQKTDYSTGYAPILQKKVWYPSWDTVDYGVWHFHRPLPFHGMGGFHVSFWDTVDSSTRRLEEVSVLLVRGEPIDMPPRGFTSSRDGVAVAEGLS